jgi:hypothetical protein
VLVAQEELNGMPIDRESLGVSGTFVQRLCEEAHRAGDAQSIVVPRCNRTVEQGTQSADRGEVIPAADRRSDRRDLRVARRTQCDEHYGQKQGERATNGAASVHLFSSDRSIATRAGCHKGAEPGRTRSATFDLATPSLRRPLPLTRLAILPNNERKLR